MPPAYRPQAKFLHPTHIEGAGPRFVRHPGPYPIGHNDMARIFSGIEDLQAEPYGLEKENIVLGDTDPQNMRVLCRIAAHIKPKLVLEVSTFRGKTALNLAKLTQSDGQVFTVDLPKEDYTDQPYAGTDAVYFQTRGDIGRFFKGTPEEKRIKQVFADATGLECQRLIEELLKGEKLDLAYIDTAHTYEATRDVFNGLVYPNLRKGGVAVFDDYYRPLHSGVTHFLTRKAHDEGYVFYWFAPFREEQTQIAFFVKVPEAVGYRWRNVKEVAPKE